MAGQGQCGVWAQQGRQYRTKPTEWTEARKRAVFAAEKKVRLGGTLKTRWLYILLNSGSLRSKHWPSFATRLDMRCGKGAGEA